MGIAEVVPQLDSCCCGCQLRTGSKFVGWCGLIFGIIGVIIFVMAVIGVSVLDEKGSSKYTPEQLKAAKITAIMTAVLYLLKVLISILLLCGVYQEKLNYYLPWIICAMVAVLLDFITIIIFIIQNEWNIKLLGIVIGICIECYFILVVYSDYRRQKELGRGGH